MLYFYPKQVPVRIEIIRLLPGLWRLRGSLIIEVGYRSGIYGT